MSFDPSKPVTTFDDLSRTMLDDVLEWDVDAWQPALEFWRRAAGDLGSAEVLDIGARDGGVSLWFALHGARVVCSDLGYPTDKARALHERYGLSDRIRYEDVNATAIAFPAESFDIVCFKSVLGGIGSGGRFDAQIRAIAEMHRVLRPGGRLLFAENMSASPLHSLSRRFLVKWGGRWRYLLLRDIPTLLAPFAFSEMEFHGFLTAFGRSPRQKRLLHAIDAVVLPLIPTRFRYIVVGCARKAPRGE